MKKRLILTTLPWEHNTYIAAALYQGERLLEVQITPTDTKKVSRLDEIYVARVKEIVPRLNAAFLEIAPGLSCYFPLAEAESCIFVKKTNSPRLVAGDELLVQVVKDAAKGKPPQVSSNLNLTGKYLVLTTGNKRLGFSHKLKGEEVAAWRKELEEKKPEDLGLIVRTNCKSATRMQVEQELFTLQQEMETLLKKAPYQSCYACLRKQLPDYLKVLQNLYTEDLETIVCEGDALFQEVEEYLKENQPEDLTLLRRYEDPSFPLRKCYSLETRIEEALSQRVWLKSGGFLVIQPTEALTVIDVNSGKAPGKTKAQEYYEKINLEAADEIAHQLRLRNLSGIIIVDFIDLTDSEKRKGVLERLKLQTKSDPIPVQVVDETKLNLVELTRKKVRKPLKEQFEE